MDASSTFSKHGARARHFSLFFSGLDWRLLNFYPLNAWSTTPLSLMLDAFIVLLYEAADANPLFMLALVATTNSAELG